MLLELATTELLDLLLEDAIKLEDVARFELATALDLLLEDFAKLELAAELNLLLNELDRVELASELDLTLEDELIRLALDRVLTDLLDDAATISTELKLELVIDTAALEVLLFELMVIAELELDTVLLEAITLLPEDSSLES